MQENEINDFQSKENISTFEKIKNIRIGNEPTLDEKIDYIYKTLKAQKRNARMKIMVVLIFIIAMYYFSIMILPTIPQEKTDEFKSKITKFISSQVSEIAKPMIEDISKDMIQNNSSNINNSKLEEFYKKYPELRK